MRTTARTRRGQDGFTLIELMLALALLLMLAAIAAPQLPGAREKAKHGACLDMLHVLDGELVNRMETLNAVDSSNPAQDAIDEVLARLEADENSANPRNLGADAFDTADTTLFVPPPETSCTVYLIDGTGDHPVGAPTVVLSAYEYGVTSFRLVLD